MKASEFFNQSRGSYRAFVWSQLEKMEVDDLNVVDVGSGSVHSFRMNLGQYAQKEGKKFRTKVANGDLYVGRIC